MSIPLDENRIPVGCAVTNDANLTVVPLKVDPLTDYLLIEIEPVTSTVPVTLPDTVIDENRINVATAVTDDANLDTSLLIMDSRNGKLFVDVIVE